MPATKDIPSRPARSLDLLIIYASGLGDAIESVTPGEPAPLNRPILLKNKISVVVGAEELEPELAALGAERSCRVALRFVRFFRRTTD